MATNDEGHWLASFDRRAVRRLVPPRSVEIALQSPVRYARPLVLEGDTVHAVLGADSVALGDDTRVALRASATSLTGACSRCAPAFGPCAHMAVVAVDLAASPALRGALLTGQGTDEACARAPEIRHAQHVEASFDGALSAWLGAATEGLAVEIAATPFADVEPGRAYGDRADADAPVLTVLVRRVGDRKLLSAREITALASFGPRERRVLEHLRDRGATRKSAYAVGVFASLTLEAMREHGRILSMGFVGRLSFRSTRLRPSITLSRGGSGPAGSQPDVLAASWVAEDGLTVPFSESVFFPGPFPFVWTRRGPIHPVASDVDQALAAQLARAPVLHVPPGRLKEAGARLLQATELRGVRAPSRETFGLPPREAPTFVLRLAGEPLNVMGDLVAVYSSREVSLFATAEGERAVTEGRDLGAEARARALVLELGIARRCDEDEQDATGEEVSIAMAGERAVAFWREGLQALRAFRDPAIRVELTERLARVRLGAPVQARVHVALEGQWLDTHLSFASGELPVELEAIRTALARKQRWITLRDGTLAAIGAAVEALTEEAALVLDGDRALVPMHQLGRLDRWIQENDGHVDAAVHALRERLRPLAVAQEPAMPTGLCATLRPYQRQGLAWLQFLQALGAGGILADDMGLGKTVTTLAFLLRWKEASGPAPSLVVCPTSVATNWVREAARFTPGLRVVLLKGPSRAARLGAGLGDVDIAITTYGLLRRDVDALAAMRFRAVVLDEAQTIKNADSATTRAASRLDASMRLALSGTPIENRLGELWSLASFANPGILGRREDFEVRYERPLAADAASPAGPVLRALVRPFLLRRTKDDVLRELPPKTEIDRIVPLRNAEKRRYDALALALREGLKKKIEQKGPRHVSASVFAALTRLRQMACDPRLVDPRLPASTSVKREAFLDLVRELVDERRRALVFSQFVGLLTLWRRDLDEEGIAYEYLDGSTVKRDEVVQRFQTGRAPLFLISLKAGGAGLNLTAADTVIHCDPWWNPAVEDQAADRAYRIGQDKPVTVVRLVTQGTLEEKILELKGKKRDLARAVLGSEPGALDGISAEDIASLLGHALEGADVGSEPVPTDALATATEIVSPDYDALVAEVQRWTASTGRLETELASVIGIPVELASRLVRGEPFPCSRALGRKIRARLRAF